MANWYVSSVAYSAVQTWSALTGGAATPVSTGTIVRQTSPALNAERCFRCSTAGTTGTSEPTWVLTSNGTTTDGTVTWTECTAQEAYQQVGSTSTWTAPAARIGNLSSTGKNVISAGDNVFLSSDHAETQSTALTLIFGGTGASASITNVLCVSRTSGNVPPLGSDVTTGASISTTGASNLFYEGANTLTQGVSFSAGSGSSAASLFIEMLSGSMLFKNCSFIQGSTYAGGSINFQTTVNGGVGFILDNCPMELPNNSQTIHFGYSSGYGTDILWRNTRSAINFTSGTARIILGAGKFIIDGVDFSSYTSSALFNLESTVAGQFLSVRNCTIGSGGSWISAPAGVGYAQAEFINCDSANTNYNNSWYTNAGQTTTSTSTYRNGGAEQDSTPYSVEMVTSSIAADSVRFHEHHIWLWNTVIGASKTATVELSSGGTLTNAQVWGGLEYLGDSGDCLSSFVSNAPATPLTAASNLPSSSATWTGGAGTNQKIDLTFTAEKTGWLHFIVKMAQASSTIYVDPKITVS